MKPRYGTEDDPQNNQQPPKSVLEMLSFEKPSVNRSRSYEKKNPATSYRIPTPLIQIAKEAQEKILGIAENDEDGKPRSGLNVDTIADAILRWAIRRVTENPKKYLPQSVSPKAKSGTTVYAAEWEDWNGTPPVQIAPRRRNKKNQTPRFHISYRLQAKTTQEIKDFSVKSGLSLGELFLYLLQFGIAGHEKGQFRIKPTTVQIVYSNADYEEIEK